MTGILFFFLYFGRFVLGAVFVVFGLRHIGDIPMFTAKLAAKGGLPQPRLWITAGVGIQIVGGRLVATGFFAWLGALALAVFVVLAGYLFHPFWEYSGDERNQHITACLMNAALAGAFLMVFAISFY